MVASAAVAIFCSFEKRYAGANTYFMVHEVRNTSRGVDQSASDIKRLDKLYDRITERYAEILAGLSKDVVSIDEWKEKMECETWFTAEEALQWGLVTEIK